jgi:hypothetical protein
MIFLREEQNNSFSHSSVLIIMTLIALITLITSNHEYYS